MQFQIGCPGCQTVLAIEAEPGQQIQCPACGTHMLLTAPPAPEPPPPPAPTYLDDLQSAFAAAPPPPPASRRSQSLPSAQPPAPPGQAGKAGKVAAPGKSAPAGTGKGAAPAGKTSGTGPAPSGTAAKNAAKPAAKGTDGTAPAGESEEGEGEPDMLWGYPRQTVYMVGGGAGGSLLLLIVLLFVFSGGKRPEENSDDKAKPKTSAETPVATTPNNNPRPNSEISVWLPAGVKVLGSHRIAHGEAVNGVALSGDGKRMITGGWDKIVRLWDTENCRLIRRLSGHTDTVWAVAFSSDGLLAASGGSDNQVRIWDATAGKLLQAVPTPEGEPVRALAFTPDGKSLAAGGDGKVIQVYDTATGALGKAYRGHGETITALAYSPDGQWLASGCRDKVVRFIPVDAMAGTQVGEIPFHQSVPTAVAFSPDSQTLASIDESQVVVVTSVSKKVLKKSFGTGPARAGPASLAFSANGATIVAGGSDGSIRVFDADTGVARGVMPGHTGPVLSLSLTKEGLLASASADRTVRLWDTMERRERLSPSPGGTGYVYAVAFSPDGGTLAAAGDDRLLRLWNGRDPGAAEPMVCDLTHESGIHAVAWTKDSKKLATAGFDRRIGIWEAGKPTPLRLMTGHAGEVLSVAWAPDGRKLVSGGQDQSVRVWDTNSGQLVRDPIADHAAAVNAVAWSPDGKLIVSGSADGIVKLRKADLTGEPTELPGHTGAVRTAAFSADSRLVATGGDDSTVRVWTAAGAEVLVFQAVRGPVRSVAFRPDGRSIAVATGWGEVALHDPSDGALQHWFQFPTPIEGVSFSPDGKTLATANGNTSLYLLDVSRPSNPLIALADAEGEEPSSWTASLRDESKAKEFRTAAGAAAKLGRHIPPSDLTLLINRLGDPNAEIRSAAAGALGAAGLPAIPLLAAVLKAPGTDAARRATVVNILGAMGSDTRYAATLINGALKDASAEVRSAAAAGVGKLGPSSVETLLSLLDSKDAPVRAAAAAGLADEAAVPTLVKLLAPATDAKKRRMALSALAKVGHKAEKEAKPVLLEMMVEKDAAVRADAAAALGSVDSGNPDAVAALSLALSVADEERAVRMAALRSLGQLGRAARESAPALLGAFDPESKDPLAKDADFQVAAAETLTKVGALENAAAPVLVAALTDKRPAVRGFLVQTLANMGANAVAVVVALEKVGDAETDPDLRQQIQVVVAKLKSAVANQ